MAFVGEMVVFAEQRKQKLGLYRFTASTQMVTTLYNLSCFLIGSDTIFKVEIDPAKEVGNLKNAIKQQKPVALKDIDADHLMLDRVTINKSLRRAPLINQLKTITENSHECQRLDDDLEVLSGIFGETPPTGQVYFILVRTPEGESIYPVASVASP